MKTPLPSENPDARQVARLAGKLRKAGDHDGAERLIRAAQEAMGPAPGGWSVVA